MKILITGCNGFLGNNLVSYFLSQENEVVGIDLQEKPITPEVSYHKVDLRNNKDVCSICMDIAAQVIVNTVALVELDLCEKDKALAFAANVTTAENIASAAGKTGARLIHISTDHLFKGDNSFYTEEALPSPVNNYGLTKLEAERRCLSNSPDTVIVRTNFYGLSHNNHPPTFAEWLYEGLVEKRPLSLFSDYYFTPIEVSYFASALEEVLRSKFQGIINICGTQRCSKYSFGMAMAKVFGFGISNISEVRLRADSFIAARQPDLSLSVKKFQSLFKTHLPDVQEGLTHFKKQTAVLGAKG